MMDPVQLLKALWVIFTGRRRVTALCLLALIHIVGGAEPQWDGTSGIWVHENRTTIPLDEMNLVDAKLAAACARGPVSTVMCPDVEYKGDDDPCWGSPPFTARYHRYKRVKRAIGSKDPKKGPDGKLVEVPILQWKDTDFDWAGE